MLLIGIFIRPPVAVAYPHFFSPIVYSVWGRTTNSQVNIIKWNRDRLGADTVVLAQSPDCARWLSALVNEEGIKVICMTPPTLLPDIYVHNSINSAEFEMNCVGRFFHLASYCEANKTITRVRFLDGDIMMVKNNMFPNLNDVIDLTSADVIGTIPTGSYYLDISCEALRRLRDYALKLYSGPRERLAYVIARYGRHRPNNNGIVKDVQFSDMHLFRAFISEATTVYYHRDYDTSARSPSADNLNSSLRTLLVGMHGEYKYVPYIARGSCNSTQTFVNASPTFSSVAAIHFQGCKHFIEYARTRCKHVFLC